MLERLLFGLFVRLTDCLSVLAVYSTHLTGNAVVRCCQTAEDRVNEKGRKGGNRPGWSVVLLCSALISYVASRGLIGCFSEMGGRHGSSMLLCYGKNDAHMKNAAHMLLGTSSGADQWTFNRMLTSSGECNERLGHEAKYRTCAAIISHFEPLV